MRPIIQSTPSRIARRCALAAAVLVCFALTGCEEVDSLEAIRQQQSTGDFASSVEPLRELLAKRPDDPEVNFLYGRALSMTQPNLAVWSLRKAMEDPEWLVPAGMQLALLSLTADDFNEVVKVTGRILEREPDNVRALLYRANAYAHSKKDPELALADARRVLEIDPKTPEAYEPLILALLGLDRVDEAGEALAEAGRLVAELGTDEGVLAWHCATTATFEQETGKLEQARKTWLACLEAHPTNLDVVSSAVNFYDDHGERARSLEVLRAALAAEPNARHFRITLAQRLQASGDTAAAEAVLREATRATELEPAVAALMDLAKYLQGRGEYGAAADAIGKAVELTKDADLATPQLLFEYADALVLADRLDPALELADDLPVPAHRHLIRGRVAQERRDPVRALAEFDEVLRLWPDNSVARYYAALAAEELGDFRRAIEEFRNAIRKDPGATDARTRAAGLLMAEGSPGRALMMLQTSMSDAPLEIEGLLLAMRLSGLLGNTTGVADFLALIEKSRPAWAGRGLAEAAEGLARRGGPALAVSMLTTAPGVDFGEPRYAPALRALVRFAHQEGATPEMRAEFQKIFEANPDSSPYQAIRGLDLELSGAAPEAVREAYSRALELAPENGWALAGLGRLAAHDDPQAALGYFDRAAAADPTDLEPKLAAVKALVALGKTDQAAQRLDALLLDYPYVAEAAAERARLDLEQGVATPRTLERAHRAVRFGGGPDALELLSRVHAQRNEHELAARAAEQARALREAKESEG